MSTPIQLAAIVHLKSEGIHWSNPSEYIAHIFAISRECSILIAQIEDAQAMLDINGPTPNSEAQRLGIRKRIGELERLTASLIALKDLTSFTEDEGW